MEPYGAALTMNRGEMSTEKCMHTCVNSWEKFPVPRAAGRNISRKAQKIPDKQIEVHSLRWYACLLFLNACAKRWGYNWVDMKSADLLSSTRFGEDAFGRE